jgi:uncharacterized protein YjdB
MEMFYPISSDGAVVFSKINLRNLERWISHGSLAMIFSVLFLNPLFTQTTITKSIATGADDVEEEGPDGVSGGPGYMYNTSTTIELIRDDQSPSSGNQKIGLRFTGLTIPKNAVITNAFITFVARSPVSPNTNNGSTSLTIRGEAADNAGSFTTTNYNVSNRSTTAASASWSPGTWSTQGTSYNSTSVASVVQEIVNRSGWASGNAMVFIITGTGSRTAYSYEGSTSQAAKLTITYTTASPIILSTSVTNVLCRGAATGAIDLTVSGGVPGYTYDWSNNGPNDPDIDPQDLINVVAGSYVVTVTDAVGTTATATATITQPSTSVSLTGIITKVSSPGGNNGAIDITVIGGTPGYTYVWSNGANTQDIQNLTAGSYQVTVTDANGCTRTSSFDVTTNTNNAIVSKQLYLSDGLSLDRLNPAAPPIDNTTALTSTLSNAAPGVAIQNISHISSTSGSAINLSHTISNSDNRLLLVGVSARERNVNAITYGGVAMTLVGTANNGLDARIYIYRMINPPVGTANIAVTFSGSLSKGAVVGAISYSGVNQSNPLGSFVTSNADSNAPSVSAPSANGDLVFDILALKNTNALTPGAGQTERWDIASGVIRGGCSTEPATTSSTTMSWSTSKGKWVMGAVSIKPAAVISNVTFTQNPVLCSALTVKANEAITVETFVNIVSGAMPVNPNITAVLRYGATTILSLSNPTYNSSDGKLTWTATRGTDITIPQNQAITLQITTAQSGVSFGIRHDSNTFPSKITLPVSTFINITVLDVYNASFPNGTAVSNIPNVGNSYIRVHVTDPFGAYDITGVNLALTKPDNSTVNIALDENNVVGSIACGKVYQYTLSNPGDLGQWNISATALEGSEGVTFSANINKTVIIPTGPVVVTKQLYLSDPSQSLDRIDPVNTNDGTTAQTVTLSSSGTTSTTFTQNPALCSPLTIKANEVITVRTFVSIISGTMPANPAITVQLRHSGTTFATINNPSFSNGQLVWSVYLPQDLTIPAGQAISMVVTTSQSNVSFRIDYDSQTKPSRIEFPVSTFIDVTSLNAFSAAFPGGSIINTAQKGSTVYFRAVVADPFGPGDITGITIGISPLGITPNATSVATSGCTRTYQYTWNTPNVSGDYNITATAREGYENTVVDFTYLNFSLCPLDITPSILTIPTCLIPDGGETMLNISGGKGPYNYNWSRSNPSGNGSGTGNLLTNLTPGNYTVTVTAAGGCSGTASFSIQAAGPPIIELMPANTGSLCFDGSIDLMLNGGSGDFSYFWADGFYTPDRENLRPGTYYLTVTDNESGCTASAETEINLGSPIDAVVFYLHPSCHGSNNGSLNLTPIGGAGGYSFQWSDGPVTKDRNSLAAGNYIITITDSGGCSAAYIYTLTEPDHLQINLTPSAATCNQSGRIQVEIIGGVQPFSYDWADIPGNFNIQNRSGLASGTYSITVTDINLCTASDQITLTAPDCDPDAYAVCRSSLNQYFSVEPDPDVDSYIWTVPEGAVIVSGQGSSAITVDWSNVLSGSGWVCVTAINECGVSEPECTPMYVKEVAAAAVVAPPVCVGAPLQLIGSGGIAYRWAGPNNFSSSLENPVIENASSAHNGIYIVTVTNGNGCTATASVEVNVNPKPNITLQEVNASDCGAEDGSVLGSPSGGTSPYQYRWSNGVQTQNLTEIGVGSYRVTITDSNGCTGTNQASLGYEEGLTVEIYKTNVTCHNGNNGTAQAIVTGESGNFSYLWSNGLSTPTIADLRAGTYIVTINDIDDGCSGVSSIVITQPSMIQLDRLISHVTCFGGNNGSVNLIASGGAQPYNFDWADLSGSNNVEDRSSLIAGNYTVTVTDANSCTASININVNQPPSALSLNFTTGNVSCYGMTNGFIDLTPSGGTLPYAYIWNNGSISQDRINLGTGSYSVTVTDAAGCSATINANITEPDEMYLSHSKSDVKCHNGFDGSINLTVHGGTSPFSFVWSNGELSEDLNNLIAESYSVRVTDANGCIATRNITIVQPNPIVLTQNASNVLCYGGTNGFITTTVNGGTPGYSYLWTDGRTTKDIYDLAAGAYNVTVSDANLCTKTGTISVNQPAPLDITGVSGNVNCFGSFTGNIDITVTGGTAGYTYNWSNGSTQEDPENLPSGIYTITVTDANSCTNSIDFGVSQPSPLSVNAIPSFTGCHGQNQGTVTAAVSGGTAPYRYSWSNGFSTQSISNLRIGYYTVTITDNNGCINTAQTLVTQPDRLINGITAVPPCPNQSNGSAVITTTGGTTPYQYQWSDIGTAGASRSGLSAGNYAVTVTDANACSAISTFTNTPITLEFFNIDPTCGKDGNGGVIVRNDGEVYLKISGGITPYSIIWSNGQNSDHITQLSPGNYSVTVVGGACQATAQTTLSSGTCIPPVANDDFYTTEMNIPVSGNIAENDYDPNTEYPLTFLPLGIVDSDKGKMDWHEDFDGSFTFYPAIGYYGTFSVPYQVCDTLELCDIGLLTIRVEKPVAGVAKTIISGPDHNGDGSYNVTYSIRVQNYSLFNLSGLQVTESLDTVFAGSIGWQLNNISSSDFTVNFPGFNGTSNKNLLTGTDILPPFGSGTIQMSITITPGAKRGPYYNHAHLKTNAPSGLQYNDLSQNGVNPDPDNDGDPTNNNVPTPLLFCPGATISGSETICVGSTTTMSPSTGGFWTSTNPAVATINNSGIVTAVSPGTASFIYSQDLCNSEPSAPVTVTGVVTAVTGSTSICIGTTTNLSPTSGGSWTSTNPAVATVNNSGVVTGIADGTATFIFQHTASGCSSPPTQVVSVSNRPIVSITGPTSICVGNTTTLNPSSGGTWTSSNPSVATVTNSGIVTGVAQGIATFTFTHSTGCVSLPTAPVTINGRPTISLAGDNSICIGSTTQFLPSTGGIWTSSNPAVAGISGSGLVTGLTPGNATFTFTESSSGCASDPSQPITVKSRPTASLTGAGEICVGFNTQLSPTTGGIWTSSNTAVATVSNAGVVFGVSAGQATFSFRDITTDCVSLPTTPVTVNPRPAIQYTGPTSICAGSTTTLSPVAGGTWTSSNPSIAQINNAGVVTGISPGSVTFTFTQTSTGCVSNASGPLTVLSRPVVSITGPAAICVNSTTTLSPGTGGTWTSSNTSVAIVNNSGIVTGIAPGSAVFYFTETASGCTSLATASIIVTALPTIALAGPSQICQGSTTNVTPSSGGTWVSSNPAIATVNNAGLVTGISNGTVFLTFTDANGCSASGNIAISINGKPSTSLNGPGSICIGSSTAFLPSTGGTWISNNPSVATISSTGIVTGVAAGSATFRFTDNNTGCISDNTISITVNNNPLVNITGPTTICAGSTTSLTPTVGGSWTSLNPAVATVNNSGIVTGVSGGTASFIFTQSSTGCVSAPTASVVVNNLPNPEFAGLTTICIGSTTQILPSSGGTWTSTNPSVASITNSGIITGLSQGNARFIFTSSLTGCVSNQSALLTVVPKPSVNVSGSDQICIGSTTTLFPSTGGSWISTNPTVATVSNSGIVTGVTSGSATFIFTDSTTGCSSNATQPVYVSSAPNTGFSGPQSICAGFSTTLTPSSGGVWVSNNPGIAIVNASGVVTGLSSGLVTFTYTQLTAECNIVITTDTLRVNYCFQPDFNITTVNVSVQGNIRTNDMMPLSTTYGTNPNLISRPPGSVANLIMNTDGQYLFTANLPGEYIYQVPVCVSGSLTTCPNSSLTITVLDIFSAGKKPVANMDRAETYTNPNPALPGNPVTLQTLTNDKCIYGSGCTLDPLTVMVLIPPAHGTYSIGQNGDITYTPNPGFVGTDILTYRVCVTIEPSNCAAAQQIIQIFDINSNTGNSTLANDDFFITYQETPVSGNVKINDLDPEGHTQSVMPAGDIAAPLTIPGGKYYLDQGGNFYFTPDAGFTGTTSFVYTTCDDHTESECAKATVNILVLKDLPVTIRVFLEGPLHNNGNIKAPDNRPLMRDNLRMSTFSGQNCVPMMSPYKYATDFVDVRSKYIHQGAGELVRLDSIKNPMSVFSVTGQNAIVDWIFIELRSKLDNKEILASRAGLLQRDGDIVDTDGVSPISFPGVGVDSFYVVVKHRNHLGAMTQLVPITGLIDFTVPSTPLFDFGQHPNGYNYSGLAMNTQIKLGYRALWAGDFDGDGKLKFVNPSDDQNILFFEVFAYPDNLINSANYNFALGYQQGDYDLNGKSKYENPDDDKNLLFSQILLYPLNTNLLSNFNYLIQQVPTPNPK